MKNMNAGLKEINHLKRTQKDYSVAFELQVADEVEKGYFDQFKDKWHSDHLQFSHFLKLFIEDFFQSFDFNPFGHNHFIFIK